MLLAPVASAGARILCLPGNDMGVLIAGKFRLTQRRCDGMFDGMKTMTHRTTFSLDQETAGRLRRLSAAWQVSQAEVVRRALAMAESSGARSADAASLLRQLHGSGEGLARESAEMYLSTVLADRQQWREES